ncbi:hypothetical protein OHU17_29190 [Streptomyces goshikiensis]|uniref:Uncharacterized protein n=1 Tax=Streptomyces goshikiensis TaxID=1942 RepID=A0ABZ1RST6_9ACTN|nr:MULTISPECIES: hypothetical protein [Streptomyces]WBY19218.1 hypothetical protein PET44_06020 [Streptomyces goshikiensis]WSR97999.1 hypothetical protein OG224_07930 [Streptomyces goshikiensis]
MISVSTGALAAAEGWGGPMSTARTARTPHRPEGDAAGPPLRRCWLTRRLHIDLLRVCSATPAPS